MDIVLPHILATDEKIPNSPGWISCTEYGTDKILKPIIRCNCGDFLNLKDHFVDADGKVSASFYDVEQRKMENGQIDPRRGCGWHVFITLKGWTGQIFKPGDS